MMPGVSMKEIRDAILDAYDPQTLQMSVAHLQERLTAFEEQATGVQEQLAARRRSTAR